MSYANMDGVPTQTAGTSELLASDWNTYVRDNFDSIKFGHVVCTSSTRPTGIAEGTMIYETDTDKVLVYSGSAWVEISDITNGASNPIQRNVASTTKTDTTSTTSGSFADISGMSVSITPSSSSSKVLVIASLNIGLNQSGNSYYAMVQLVRGSTAICIGDAASTRQRATSQAMPSGTIAAESITMVHLDSPATTSSTTYKLQWFAVGGVPTYLNRSDSDPDSSSRNRSASTITVMEVPA